MAYSPQQIPKRGTRVTSNKTELESYIDNWLDEQPISNKYICLLPNIPSYGECLQLEDRYHRAGWKVAVCHRVSKKFYLEK